VQLQFTSIQFSAPDPAGELTALPQTFWLDFGGKIKEGERGGEKERARGKERESKRK